MNFASQRTIAAGYNVAIRRAAIMNPSTTFDEILDAVEALPPDQQADLIDVVRRRLAERGRKQILADAHAASEEHDQGKTRVSSVDDLMREIKS